MRHYWRIVGRERINTLVERPRFYLKIEIESTLHGVHWIMHEHDEDINDPSCPHCHAKEKNWKLDIYSGEIYDYTNKKTYITKLTKKEMKRLWTQKGFVDLVLRERQYYEEHFHQIDPQRYPKLKPLHVNSKHKKYKVCISNKWLRRYRKEK